MNRTAIALGASAYLGVVLLLPGHEQPEPQPPASPPVISAATVPVTGTFTSGSTAISLPKQTLI
jgi:hypothetical protein